MADLNKIMIIGRLGKDPTIKTTQGGLTICNFNVATTTKIKENEYTEWHRVVAFGRLAEVCGEYLVKGKQVYIEGRVQTREWENKDGEKKETFEIIAEKMLMLGSNPQVKQQKQKEYAGGNEYEPAQEDQEIPF